MVVVVEVVEVEVVVELQGMLRWRRTLWVDKMSGYWRKAEEAVRRRGRAWGECGGGRRRRGSGGGLWNGVGG